MTAGTRERMIVSAALLMRERGARATSIDDVLGHSGAPRGSVYHHFPGGRDELLREAIAYAGDYVARRLDLSCAEDPLAAFDRFLVGYRDTLVQSDLHSGCPLAAVAVESGADGGEALAEAGRAFERWQELLAAGFAAAGIARARARELAVLAVVALEGALIVARACQDVSVFDSVRAQLRALLAAELKRGAT